MDTLKTFNYVSSLEKQKPPTNKNYYRIYEHNLCPQAEKVRAAFAAKNLKFQLVEMDLINKAQWHLNANGGSVPLLETPLGEFKPFDGLVNFAN